MSRTLTPRQVPFVGLKAQAERLRAEVERRLGVVLDHGAYVNGPEIAELEIALVHRVQDARADAASEAPREVHCVACSSGTDALVMAMLEAEIGSGDVVFVPSFTFTATAEVVHLVGATPRFVDVDEATMNIDPRDLERQIAEVKKTTSLRPRGVLAVDLFGLAADYPALAQICEREDLALMADAAQSFGGSLGGVPIGRLAPITTTSFFPAKPLGGYGDGGAVLTTEAGKAERLRSIRQHGEGPNRYDIVRIGINGRLDTFQAAVLLAKLGVFDEEIASRETVAQAYDEGLRDLALTLAPRREGARSVWAQYTLQVNDRDRVRAELGELGVPTAVYYPLPMHLQPAYATEEQPRGSLPVSEMLSECVFSLPMNPYQASVDTEYVVAMVSRVVGGP